MSYPIKFKIIPKNGRELKKGEAPILAANGNLALMSGDFYTHVIFQSCADFELWVALDKIDGKWNFKKVGH